MRLAYLPLLLLPALAQAQEACPTAADLQAGIVFDIGEGEKEVYKDIGNGVIEVTYSDTEGFESRTLLGQGVYLLELVDLEDGQPVPISRTTYSHKLTPVDMPKPSPNSSWTSEVVSLNDGNLEREVHDHRFGAAGNITLGACTYDKIRVTVHYDDGDNSVDTLEYLPDLGVGLLVGVAYDNGDGTRTDDVYRYFDVARVGAASAKQEGGRKSQGRD
ncbi:MAG: hypothetical protein AAGP08_05865 [Pseudomonadota bacterium]